MDPESQKVCFDKLSQPKDGWSEQRALINSGHLII